MVRASWAGRSSKTLLGLGDPKPHLEKREVAVYTTIRSPPSSPSYRAVGARTSYTSKLGDRIRQTAAEYVEGLAPHVWKGAPDK
jgi:hypothetical protein